MNPDEIDVMKLTPEDYLKMRDRCKELERDISTYQACLSRNGLTLTAFVSAKRSASRFTTTKTNRLFGRSSGSAERRTTGRT